MYDPIKDGVDKTVRSVRYTVVQPPAHARPWVHGYWELRTEIPLGKDFHLHAVPDACVNILFNLENTDIAGITALRTRHEVLNLGKHFHYVGIQLLPGVWAGDPRETAYQYVGTPYAGSLPLVATCRALVPLDFPAQQAVLTHLVQQLVHAKLVVSNPVTERILANLDNIRNVSDMASNACLSPRQLQRVIRQCTGLSPHDLLKVLRMQQSFKQHYLDLYADQSHYIHSFRKINGHTPGSFASKFNV